MSSAPGATGIPCSLPPIFIAGSRACAARNMAPKRSTRPGGQEQPLHVDVRGVSDSRAQGGAQCRGSPQAARSELAQVNAIKARAVERGLARRVEQPVRDVGIDEKPFRSNHRYVGSLIDLEFDLEQARTEAAAKGLIEKGLGTAQREQVDAVAVDMWPAFANAINPLSLVFTRSVEATTILTQGAPIPTTTSST